MKRQAFLGRHFQFCSMKFMLFFFLSSLVIQDVLPASIKSCELRASCSSECQDSTQKTVTVNPRSNATVGCSIMNKGSTQDLTWEQVRRKIHGSNNVYDLVLHQQQNPHCSCTQITLARPVQRVFKPSSPVWFNEKIELNCIFKGWPRPTVVWINPHGNKIKSGSDGFEIYEELIGDDTLSSVLKNPHMQEKQYGEYWCTAENSIDGWSSKLSKVTELIYECPWPINPEVSSSEVTADASSNKSFKCMIDVDPDYCADVLELQWRFNDSSAPIKSGKKYKIQERNTNSKCEKEFTLTINDVTVEDKGNYTCQSICYEETTFAVFQLKVKDVSPTGTLDCEIGAQKCQPPLETITRTVTPKDSKVNLNCSIKNGGKVQDMTWQYLEKHLNASDAGLFVQNIDSKNRSQPRECFSIKYAIPVKRVSKTSSPVDHYPDTREMELKCTFKGWPRPRVVWYNPDNKQIINGSEGFYISEQLDREDTLISILRNADIQEKHRGAYKCTGMNNITNWSSKKSGYIDLNYRCIIQAPQISSPEVPVTAYSNATLECKVGVRPSDCWDNSLRWYFNNNSAKLESGEKYNIQERKTNTRCKTDFILTIINVTEADEGKYKCQWLCDRDYPNFSRSSIIQLKVLPPSEEGTDTPLISKDSSTPSTQKTTNSTSTATSDTEAATTGQGNSKSADKWIPAIAILTSGLALFLILITAYHFISKKFGRGCRAWYKMTSDHLSSKENH